jgi:hypothetical protein
VIARTADRVPANTERQVNDWIERTADAHIAYYNEHADKIPERLRELDEEWDIERVLSTGSAALTLSGLALACVSSRRWLFLPLAVQGFFLQHALQGWCPPLPLFRRLGVRAMDEIHREREALLAILESHEGDPRFAARTEPRPDESGAVMTEARDDEAAPSDAGREPYEGAPQGREADFDEGRGPRGPGGEGAFEGYPERSS